jgi:hypothetical protein
LKSAQTTTAGQPSTITKQPTGPIPKTNRRKTFAPPTGLHTKRGGLRASMSKVRKSVNFEPIEEDDQ